MRKSFLLVFVFSMLVLFGTQIIAQNPIPLGKGSYADYIPLYEAANPYQEGSEGWGDKSQIMASRPIYVVDTNTRAIPTNDWWTDLIFSNYAGNMFAHPLMVKAQSSGIVVEYPRTWNYNGTSVESASKVEIKGEKFTAMDAKARRWGDWTFDFIMQNEKKDAEMAVTLGHGIPYVWVEYTNMNAELKFSAIPQFFDKNGNEVALPFVGDQLGIVVSGDTYGLFLPDNSIILKGETGYTVTFAYNSKYLVLAALPAKEDLAHFYTYAYAIPRDSKVSWNYDEDNSDLITTWKLTTENLKGENNKQTIQGWIPHHYRKGKLNFEFDGSEYLSARGRLKCAIGNEFSMSYKFNGMLPYMPKPDFDSDKIYKPERMAQLIKGYTGKSGYGGDTYWGGKDLLYFSQYMTFAEQMQDTQSFLIFKNKLTEALKDWYTFTPGEQEHYFAYQERWKTMTGLNASYGSDEFNDLHFHYGYFAYATGMLAMVDDAFITDYGQMAKKVVKQYANWERDNSTPFFRNFDVWEGHSWAGGVGDAWNGNGQESTSEAMQGWGGMFNLAVSMGDKNMRDAAIFGYTMESMGTQEYWFDIYKENIDYTKYEKPYNSNLTGRGIGWWTWFSGDPVWMHSIQWLPMTTSLKYLYQDTAFASWDYAEMWKKKELTGWEGDLGNESGIGNVVLSYLQVFDADSAARTFDWLWKNNKNSVKDNYTSGITYYFTHSHRNLGEIQWDKHTNMPSSTVYYNSKTQVTSVVVYNPETTDKKCILYDANNKELATLNVPPKKLIVHKLDAVLTEISVTAKEKTIEPAENLQINAVGLDQYGAQIEANIAFSVTNGATIGSTGIFSASAKGIYTITAKTGSVSGTLTIRVDEKPKLTRIEVAKHKGYIHLGESFEFRSKGFDQFDDAFEFTPEWKTSGGGTISNLGEFTAKTVGAPFYIYAINEGITDSSALEVRLPASNIALLKTVAVSSQENVGTPGNFLTDGNQTTRWSSQFADPQWVTINLGKSYKIETVKLFWEASFGKEYKLYITNDIASWKTQSPAYHNTNSDGGLDEILVEETGQYLVIEGLKRSSVYGYSLWEVEVYGTPLSTGTPVLSAMTIEPKWASIKDNETISYTVSGFDQFGNNFQVSPDWSVLGSGEFTGNAEFKPTGSGVMKIVAIKSDVSANAEIYVEETSKVASININVTSDNIKRFPLIKGVPYKFEAEGYNQFGVSTQVDAKWEVSGGGAINASGLFKPETAGDYMVFAIKGSLRDTAFVSIKEITEVDVALGKPAFASSVENEGSSAGKAVDGDVSTRWSSAWEDPQWFYVDLQNVYDIYKIRLNWEGAFGKAYEIQFSLNEKDWQTVFTESASDGGEDIIEITGETRFVRLLGTQRATGYGYSFFDFEVYASKILNIEPKLAVISIVPATIYAIPGEAIQLTTEGTDQFGDIFPIMPTWSVTGNNTINENGMFLAGSSEGEYEIKATVDSVAAYSNVIISLSPMLSTIKIYPTDTTIFTNTELQFSAKAFDFNNKQVQVPFTWEISGGGEIDSLGFFISGNVAGVYEVSVSANNTVGTTLINVVEPTGLKKNTQVQIHVYPNPASDKVFVATQNKGQFAKVTLTDVFGRVYFTKNTTIELLTIDTQLFASGIYLITIQTKERTMSTKFIINN